MMLIPDNILAWILSVGSVMLLYSHTLQYEPPWVQRNIDLKSRWDTTNTAAMFLAVIAAGISTFVYAGESRAYLALTASIVGVVTFCAIQTFLSDYAVRLADSYLLNLSNLLVISLTVLYFMVTQQITMLVFVGILLFCAAAFYFLDGLGFGQSDARALTLILTGSTAVFGYIGPQLAILGFLLFVLVYVLIETVHRKTFRGIFKKMSLPAVPLMLLPFMALLLGNPDITEKTTLL